VRKSTHALVSFFFLYEYGAPLGGPSGSWSSAIIISNVEMCLPSQIPQGKKKSKPTLVYKQNVTYKVGVVIADVYSRVNFESLQICPHFNDFEFTNWTRNREVLSLILTCFFC